jgi:serine protease AprX
MSLPDAGLAMIKFKRLKQFTALVLVLLLGVGSAFAGLTITGSNGITASGADGIDYVGVSGITASGADGYLAFTPNGITASGADGQPLFSPAGITASGADGVTYPGQNGITASGADGITISGADGITASGADGIAILSADGTTYPANSVLIRQGNGITASGADTVTAYGTDGVTPVGADGITISGADGITISGADGITISGADGITASGADGQIFSISPNGITISGADGITISGADGITISGADTISSFGFDPLLDSLSSTEQTGLQSVDPELAAQLDRLTDDSNVDAVVIYHHLPTAADIADLLSIGVLGGTRYHTLPMISITATRKQIFMISHLPAVRSIYGNRTLQPTSDPYMAVNGVERMRRDADLSSKNGGVPVTGRSVTVAVLDTGLDGTHADLAGRVVQNVKLADTQSASVGFAYPANVENVVNTDHVYGHGTFVSGIIAGSGAQSNGKYNGIAPEARLLGLSAGDLTLSFILSGFDYLLTRGPGYKVRAVNCSFSANTVFDVNDPVNVATRMLFDKGVNVVFSAGNTGPGLHTLNPYAVAPWVISVGATDKHGRLADFSSRGAFGSRLFHPTLVAPGVDIISLRSASAPSVTGVFGVQSGTDLERLSPQNRPYYTTASGTSFSAPQVVGTIALMLQANPRLTPRQVRDILQRTATTLTPYYQHEVGAGLLNVHAAVLEAAFPQRRMGTFRGTLDRGQVRFINNKLQQFSGTVLPTGAFQASVAVPQNALLASVEIAWPLVSANDLGLSLYNPQGVKRAASNTINLPGLTGKRERAIVSMPAAGTWHIRVTNSLGPAGTPQQFSGVLEVTRAQYAAMRDLTGLNAAARAEVYANLRSLVMSPVGRYFRPSFVVTRADLAAALVIGAHVPQYLPARPSYLDVRDASTMIFVESAQAAPGGGLLINAVRGGRFRPDDPVSRLEAAVALVRAAGLQAEANAKAGTPLGVTDVATIPAGLRGYVAVALERGLLTKIGTEFRPQSALTRGDLAHAIVVVQRIEAE